MDDISKAVNEALIVTTKRKGKLDDLMGLDSWNEILAEYLMAIAFGSSIISASGKLGVSPSTLTRWLERGKTDKSGPYRELWDRTQMALTQAVSNAESKLYETDPKWYLTRGPGRMLVGDLYNVESKGDASYGADGTVSDNPNAVLNIRDDGEEINKTGIPNDINEEKEKGISAALLGLRDSGIDLEHVLNHYITKHQKLHSDHNNDES